MDPFICRAALIISLRDVKYVIPTQNAAIISMQLRECVKCREARSCLFAHVADFHLAFGFDLFSDNVPKKFGTNDIDSN